MAVLEIRHRFIEVALHRLDVLARDRHESWVRLADHAVTFGRSSGHAPNIQVDDITTSRRHGAIEPHGDNYALHDLGSSGGTYFNDARLVTGHPYILQDRDLIALGAPTTAATARFHATDPVPAVIQPIEADLLVAIRERAEGADTVYADWLDEQGHADRAALVRACAALDREAPHTQTFWAAWRRRDTLSDRTDIGWRMRLIAARGVSESR